MGWSMIWTSTTSWQSMTLTWGLWRTRSPHRSEQSNDRFEVMWGWEQGEDRFGEIEAEVYLCEGSLRRGGMLVASKGRG